MVKTLSLLCILCSTQALYSQEKKELGSLGKVESKSTQSNSAKVSNSKLGEGVTYSVDRNGEQVEHNKEYYQQQVESIEKHIKSIDIKVDYIKNDEVENQLATESGWYQKMEATKNYLLEKKEQLTAKIKSL